MHIWEEVDISCSWFNLIQTVDTQWENLCLIRSNCELHHNQLSITRKQSCKYFKLSTVSSMYLHHGIYDKGNSQPLSIALYVEAITNADSPYNNYPCQPHSIMLQLDHPLQLGSWTFPHKLCIVPLWVFHPLVALPMARKH